MSDRPLHSEPADDAGAAPNGEPLVHEEVAYEPEDLRAKGILWVLIGIAAMFAGVALVAWWFLNFNESVADRAAQFAQYTASAEELPGEPRLEPLDRSEATAASDVFAKQLALEHQLHSYGKTSDQGFVHIPIEQAMKFAIAEIPVRKESEPPAKSFGLVGGGESNSGRMYAEGPSWQREK
jgi:hypothetical protein